MDDSEYGACETTVYDAESDTFQAHHNWTTQESIAVTLVHAMTTVTDKSATELDPLGAVIDPDALDGLFLPRGDDGPRTEGAVTFLYEGFTVQVRASGHVTIAPAEGDDQQ